MKLFLSSLTILVLFLSSAAVAQAQDKRVEELIGVLSDLEQSSESDPIETKLELLSDLIEESTKNNDLDAYARGLTEIGRLGAEASSLKPLIVAALSHERPEVYDAAAQALINLEHDEEIAAIEAIPEEERTEEDRLAIQTLESNEKALWRLGNRLKDRENTSPRLRRIIVLSLFHIHIRDNIQIQEFLVEGLRDPNPEVVTQAFRYIPYLDYFYYIELKPAMEELAAGFTTANAELQARIRKQAADYVKELSQTPGQSDFDHWFQRELAIRNGDFEGTGKAIPKAYRGNWVFSKKLCVLEDGSTQPAAGEAPAFSQLKLGRNKMIASMQIPQTQCIAKQIGFILHLKDDLYLIRPTAYDTEGDCDFIAPEERSYKLPPEDVAAHSMTARIESMNGGQVIAVTALENYEGRVVGDACERIGGLEQIRWVQVP